MYHRKSKTAMLLFYLVCLLFTDNCIGGDTSLCTKCSTSDPKLCEVCSAVGSEEHGPNACAACGLGMCLECNSGSPNNGKCTKCADGYTVVDGKCVACNDTVNGIPHCTTCAQRHPSYPQLLCKGCDKGYVLNSTFCPPCSKFAGEHCALCSPSTYSTNTPIKCDKCDEGYKLTKYGDKYKCKKSFTVVEILGIVFGTFIGVIVIIVSAILLDMNIDKI